MAEHSLIGCGSLPFIGGAIFKDLKRSLRLVESVKSKFGVILIFQNVAFHTQKRWTYWNFRKFLLWRVCSKCRVSGDHFHRISVEERQSRANWWSISATYKVETYTFWTGPIVRQEGNGSITLKSLFKLFFRTYVLCACKKGTKITDAHKHMAFMATRMWHLIWDRMWHLMSDKNMPFTQSLHRKLFTLVCPLHASEPGIGLLGLSSLYCNSAKKYVPGVCCNSLSPTKLNYLANY